MGPGPGSKWLQDSEFGLATSAVFAFQNQLQDSGRDLPLPVLKNMEKNRLITNAQSHQSGQAYPILLTF